MKGYQADLDGEDRYTGNLYEERGRTFMALRGQLTRAVEGGQRLIVGSLGELAELQTFTKKGDWNEFHLIARGNVLDPHAERPHDVSGHRRRRAARRMEGLLGVQVHVGPPMKVEYRNFRLKKL